MYCTVQESVQLFQLAATVLVAENSNRFLPKFPTIFVCQQTDKQLTTDLVRNALVVH
jgi:hypothetical protein